MTTQHLPEQRIATVGDIVARLTHTEYTSTAETALSIGMGPAQLNIGAALDSAIEAGLVRVVTTMDTSYARGVRFVALNEPAASARSTRARRLVSAELAKHCVRHELPIEVAHRDGVSVYVIDGETLPPEQAADRYLNGGFAAAFDRA